MSGSSISAPPRLLEHEPGDLTAIAEAGLRLSELQAALAAHGQRVSLDPPGDPTLGECLLDDLSGPLRHRYGRIRDLVIGVSVVLPDGTRASSGGRVVKNVAGYDLGKLFCGSRGRFGTVERLALRLHPAPEAARTVTISGGRWMELHRSQIVPSAVDLVDGRAHVLIEGSERSVAAQIASLNGEEVGPEAWREIRELQATLPGCGRWDGEVAALVRPGPRVAYYSEPREMTWSPLAERVVEVLCKKS
ncbi:MAG: FAD-binding oxidoreductase [Solirubrobacteraceae bacterium]